jgi:hypothetical protein
MQVTSNLLGITYQQLNVILFVILHPAITLVLFVKYRKYKKISQAQSIKQPLWNWNKSLMKKLPYFLLLVIFVTSLSLPSFAQSTPDLTGTWVLNVKTDAGSGTPTFKLKQDSEGKLTGTYQGQLGETDVKGTIQNNGFHIEFSVQGNVITYDGKIENEIMSGKVVLGTMASGTFTGKKA